MDGLFIIGLLLLGVTIFLMFWVGKLTNELDRTKEEVKEYEHIQRAWQRAIERKLP